MGADGEDTAASAGLRMPLKQKMAVSFKSLLDSAKKLALGDDGATGGPAPIDKLFAKTSAAVDGPDCEHDCETCTIHYPRNFKVEEADVLYGHVKPWSTHAIVATGKTDWVRDVADEKGSVMQAIDRAAKPSNGRLLLSASNIPTPNHTSDYSQPTTVLLLPAFTIIDNVTPEAVPSLISEFVEKAPTTVSALAPITLPKSLCPTRVAADSVDVEAKPHGAMEPNGLEDANGAPEANGNGTKESNGVDETTATTTATAIGGAPEAGAPAPAPDTSMAPVPLPQLDPKLPLLQRRPCPHSALILLCSQKTRDARCGQSAPLLRKELERHLRPLGLYRDLDDERPGGVGIYFISHVGGHKYSANMMVYRRPDAFGLDTVARATAGDAAVPQKKALPLPGGEDDVGAGQCIWLARVRPEDCENIIRYTVLQGKVVKPERQLRGGFDRSKGLLSW